MRFWRFVRLVTRVAAFFPDSDDFDVCLGEIFFSAIPFTPSRAWPEGDFG